MKAKIILGILSSDSYNDKDAFLSLATKSGFSIHSISTKIEEMAKYLLKSTDGSDFTKDQIDGIRKKGYVINKLYWLNILLTSIPEKEDRILIEDLWQDDLYEGYVTPVVSDPILVPNMNFFRFPNVQSGVTEIKRWVKEVEEKMYNTK